jgi:hypothetical protein
MPIVSVLKVSICGRETCCKYLFETSEYVTDISSSIMPPGVLHWVLGTSNAICIGPIIVIKAPSVSCLKRGRGRWLEENPSVSYFELGRGVVMGGRREQRGVGCPTYPSP